jgi:uncharacterized protein
MLITITGATGLLGQALMTRLLADGHRIRLLSRTARTGLPPGADLSLWDTQRSEPPAEALRGSDAVIHLAGEPVSQRWTPEVKQRLVSSRLDSTRLLVQALAALSERPKLLLSASAVGIYGDRGDEVLNEDSAPGRDFLARLSVDWEAQANLARGLGLRVHTLRTGIVLAANGGALEKMLPPFRFGVGGKLGSGEQWMSWIHIADWVGIVLHLLSGNTASSNAASGAVNLVSPQAARNGEFTETLGRTLRRPALLTVPAFALRVLYGEMANVLLASQRVAPNAALEAGYTFQFPQLEPALRNLLH